MAEKSNIENLYRAKVKTYLAAKLTRAQAETQAGIDLNLHDSVTKVFIENDRSQRYDPTLVRMCLLYHVDINSIA